MVSLWILHVKEYEVAFDFVIHYHQTLLYKCSSKYYQAIIMTRVNLFKTSNSTPNNKIYRNNLSHFFFLTFQRLFLSTTNLLDTTNLLLSPIWRTTIEAMIDWCLMSSQHYSAIFIDLTSSEQFFSIFMARKSLQVINQQQVGKEGALWLGKLCECHK